jgi:hypothetical protein
VQQFDLYFAIHAGYRFFEGGHVGEIGSLYSLKAAIPVKMPGGGTMIAGGKGVNLNLALFGERPMLPITLAELPGGRRIT